MSISVAAFVKGKSKLADYVSDVKIASFRKFTRLQSYYRTFVRVKVPEPLSGGIFFQIPEVNFPVLS